MGLEYRVMCLYVHTFIHGVRVHNLGVQGYKFRVCAWFRF